MKQICLAPVVSAGTLKEPTMQSATIALLKQGNQHLRTRLAAQVSLLALTNEILSETVWLCLCGNKMPDGAKQIP